MANRNRLRDVRRANFKLIERELYHYPARQKEYAEMRDAILHGSPMRDEGVAVQSPLGDVTASKALQLSSAVMWETGRRLAAIEWALDILKSEPLRFELVRLKYFEGRLTNEGIMAKLNIGHDTFYRWRKQFIALIAERLGWEV